MRYPQQLELVYKPNDATPEQIKEWRETDFFSKGDFDSLKLFVVIPTIIQIGCLLFMFGMIAINDSIF